MSTNANFSSQVLVLNGNMSVIIKVKDFKFFMEKLGSLTAQIFKSNLVYVLPLCTSAYVQEDFYICKINRVTKALPICEKYLNCLHQCERQ